MSSAKWRPFCLGLNVLTMCNRCRQWISFSRETRTSILNKATAGLAMQGDRALAAIVLTHWGLDKMDAISHTTFSNGFSWIKNVQISNKFSLKFVPRVLINNIPALRQIMAWRRRGDKPLSEPVMVNLLMHICVTRPQWVNLVMEYSGLSARYYFCSYNEKCYLQALMLSIDVNLRCVHINWHPRARFLSLARSKLRLCLANHRPGYWSNLPCDWPNTAWAKRQKTSLDVMESILCLVMDRQTGLAGISKLMRLSGIISLHSTLTVKSPCTFQYDYSLIRMHKAPIIKIFVYMMHIYLKRKKTSSHQILLFGNLEYAFKLLKCFVKYKYSFVLSLHNQGNLHC